MYRRHRHHYRHLVVHFNYAIPLKASFAVLPSYFGKSISHARNEEDAITSVVVELPRLALFELSREKFAFACAYTKVSDTDTTESNTVLPSF